MKKLFILLLLALAVLPIYSAEEVPAVTNVFGRESVSLNGTWQYVIDQQEMGYYAGNSGKVDKWGFGRDAHPRTSSDLQEYDFDKSETMQIPSDWNTQTERLLFYEGTVWFRRRFNFSPRQGHRAVLYFGAVNYHCVVYMNGERLGEHEGGFTPFCFDVTDIAKKGENSVVLKVNNARRKDAIPTQIFDWWNYGGITRDVMLLNLPETYVQDYYVQLAKGSNKTIRCEVRLNEKKAGVSIVVEIPELKLHKILTTDAEGKAAATWKCKPTLWCPENPKLYAVTITKGEETINDEIGFRTIETRGKQILLNGEPIFLKGISMHDEAPFRQGRLRTRDEAHTLLGWAKDLGCNFVRLAHYPHNELTVREAERMGVMVWSEIPVYWTIDWENDKTFRNAQRQLRDMIMRDRNRANIVIWSIANETPHGSARDSFLSRLAQEAHALDNTRLVSMAMEVLWADNFVNRLKDNMNEYVDVVSFNEYIGWYRDVNTARKMTWEIPYDKPVIVSEFGGGALYGRHGDANERWTEEFQERLYEENLAMLGKIDGLAGMSPWILKDFMSPRRPLAGTQDYFNRKGLLDERGNRKKAFYVLQRWYETR